MEMISDRTDGVEIRIHDLKVCVFICHVQHASTNLKQKILTSLGKEQQEVSTAVLSHNVLGVLHTSSRNFQHIFILFDTMSNQ